jgi:anti-sigma28 factor (negative regulator of flagellin synthesis)
MKFGVTGIERRYARTPLALPAKQRSNRNARTSSTSWEERIAKAKKLTISRRTGEQAEAFAEKSGAAYLSWLEQRTARLEKLRARIETGTYHVDSATLAEDMLRNTTRDCENT